MPLSAGIFAGDHLRAAPKTAGVRIPDGHRFGLHNLRHSLSNWMVNKTKVEPKTVQGTYCAIAGFRRRSTFIHRMTEMKHGQRRARI